MPAEIWVAIIAGVLTLLGTLVGIWANEQSDKARRRDTRDRLERDLTLLEKLSAIDIPDAAVDPDARTERKARIHDIERSIAKQIAKLGEEDDHEESPWIRKVGNAVGVALVVSLAAGFFIVPYTMSLFHYRSVAAKHYPDGTSQKHWGVAFSALIDSFGDDDPCTGEPKIDAVRSPRGAFLLVENKPIGPQLLAECEPLFSFGVVSTSQPEACDSGNPDALPVTETRRLLRVDFEVRIGPNKIMPDETILAGEDFYSIVGNRMKTGVVVDAADCFANSAPGGLVDAIPGQTYYLTVVLALPDTGETGPPPAGFIGYRWSSRGWDGSFEFAY
ncbi:hypothetical protein ACWEKT_38405 [Nocardia takedensis]